MEAMGCEYDPAQRGLFLWGKLPAGERDSATFADKVLKEARVFIVPGFIFGSNGEGYVRLSLCATEERMEEALRRIKALSSEKEK